MSTWFRATIRFSHTRVERVLGYNADARDDVTDLDHSTTADYTHVHSRDIVGRLPSIDVSHFRHGSVTNVMYTRVICSVLYRTLIIWSQRRIAQVVFVFMFVISELLLGI